jgi:hypothetical protein
MKDEPQVVFQDNKEQLKWWKVIQVTPQPSKVVALFVGPTEELAPLVAGDYVEFMNEKYYDKIINAEWPLRNKLEWARYHLSRAEQLIEEWLDENNKMDV